MKKFFILSLIFNFILLILVCTVNLKRKSEKSNLERSISDLNLYCGLLSPSRDEWQLPDRVIEIMNIKRGDVIADIGAGSGYFSYKFAKQVGPEGKVYALEINDLAINIMNRILTEARQKAGAIFDNIIVKKNFKNDINFNEHSFDIAFMCDVHFYSKKNLDSDSLALIRSIRRALKGNGKLVIIEKSGKETRTIFEAIKNNFEGLGFELVSSYDFLPVQLFMIFEKAQNEIWDRNKR